MLLFLSVYPYVLTFQYLDKFAKKHTRLSLIPRLSLHMNNGKLGRAWERGYTRLVTLWNQNEGEFSYHLRMLHVYVCLHSFTVRTSVSMVSFV